MSEKSIFERIIEREIPCSLVYEDEHCIAFHDIEPQAPVHILLVPKKRINRIEKATAEDQTLLGHLMLKVGEIARQEQFAERGFRTVINNGENGGETVPHLHIHILAERKLQWPPG